jgi:superfamily II DNA or RNA helicase
MVYTASSPLGQLVSDRPIMLTREADVFRLVFVYDLEIHTTVKQMAHARYEPSGKTWTVAVCTQNVDELRKLFAQGLTDVSVDDLIEPGEVINEARQATLRPGSARRPFLAVPAFRNNDTLYAKLRSIPGAQWERSAGAVSYGPMASTALAELVSRGLLDDPQNLLSPAAVIMAFDGRTGRFVVRGDPRAQAAFDTKYPEVDVMSVWSERGLDVAFDSDFTKEVYRGELARASEGLQPQGLLEPLFAYQAKTAAVAVERSGLGIFDSPGLGKTATAVATAFELMVNRHQANRTVVVVPGAVRTQWAQEITRFTGHTDVVVVKGDLKTRKAAYAQGADSRWVVVNYDVIARDIKLLLPLVTGSVLIADECHRLKNPTAKRTKAARQLASKASRRLALTGTPVENEPGEWFSVLSGFAVPGLFGSPIDFLNRYQYPGRFGGFEGARNLPELRERSRVHYIRHTKSQVASHLPPLRVQHLPIDPDPAYATALRRAHREAAEEIKQAALSRSSHVGTKEEYDEVATGAEMTAVSMLRLLCSSPRLVAESDSAAGEALRSSGLVPDADGPKIDELRVMAIEAQLAAERLVVFSFSKRMVDLISTRLTEDGVRHVTFTGATSSDDRDAAVKAFSTPSTETDPGPTVFLATDAGAEGLNLGRCCSTVVNMDIPWTPARLEQRANRIHRIDTAYEACLVINMTLRGTIEEGILRMVEHKADLADAIFGEAGGRRKTTGRPGRNVFANVFEEALSAWSDEPD